MIDVLSDRVVIYIFLPVPLMTEFAREGKSSRADAFFFTGSRQQARSLIGSAMLGLLEFIKILLSQACYLPMASKQLRW